MILTRQQVHTIILKHVTFWKRAWGCTVFWNDEVARPFTEQELFDFLLKSKIDERPHVPEIDDCDDKGWLLKGDAILEAKAEAPWAIGIICGSLGGRNHVMNWVIMDSLEFRLIEGGTDGNRFLTKADNKIVYVIG